MKSKTKKAHILPQDSWAVISLMREDFQDYKGWRKISDADMDMVARKIGDGMMDGGDYWEAIRYWAKELKLKKLKK
jgi:hypothetical protein